MIVRITLLIVLLACTAQAVLNKDFKRREAFDTYGPPPRPAPQYGPPPGQQQQHLPHREYGVPQQIPFREYGPPALKYGPPKLNSINGGNGGGGFHNGGANGNGLHEQIKTHFGVPKPFYGPPHLQHKPAPAYGPPKQQYGPPQPRPQAQYGPPPQQQQQQHRPAQNYGPPQQRPNYGPPPPPQSLPSSHPGPIFKPAHHPASSYGPPPSGPLNQHPQVNYGPPPPNYGPPPLPQRLPGPQLNRVPETTIILTNGGGQQQQGGSIKQEQIQIDSSGHTHSVTGSQAPFHTACDGWKPIATPIGVHIENNHIDSHSGYSQVSQGGFGTQYSSGGNNGGHNGGHSAGNNGGHTTILSSGPGASGGNIVDGLTDEQLVAIALQSGSFDGHSTLRLPAQPLPPTGPANEFQQHSLNSIDSDLHLEVASLENDDSYSRPPPDSFAPGSSHAHKYNTLNGGHQGPPPPSGNYGPPPAAFVQHQQQQQHHHQNHQQSSAAQAGLGIQYGTQSGNLHSFPPQGIPPPNKPVAYRPPVPQGLLESIGATVQHLDQFGVKPQNQPPTYIPPAANEFAQTGPGNVGPEYGPPPAPQGIFEQQLPQQQPPHTFYQEQQRGNEHSQYGLPPPPPHLPLPTPNLQQQQFVPPPPPPTAQGQNFIPPSQQYLPPQQQQGGTFSQTSNNQLHYENSFSSSQHNEQFVHAQGLPVQQQESRFNQVHDCGHGPNLYSAGNQQFQQQQQQQFEQHQQQQIQQQHQHQQYAAASSSSYNAIEQSIPVAEQHTQFISGPSDSYGPPASGNELDHLGYASQKNSVATLPDGTDPQSLPGLDGLNVISAQKSHSIQLTPEQAQNHAQHSSTTYQLQFGGPSGSPLNGEQSANHEEILSQGLLQSILTAIEQPSNKQQQQAQSRSDIDLHEDATEEIENEPALAESSKVEVKVSPDTDTEEVATVTELKAIIPEEETEAASKEEDDARK